MRAASFNQRMRRLSLFVIAALALGCGSVVEIASTSSLGTGGATSIVTGAGGATTTTTTTSDTFTFPDPPPACDPDGTFVVIFDGATTVQLDKSCAPTGFFLWPGGASPPPPPGPPPPPQAGVMLNGCPSSTTNPVILMSGYATVWPGPTQAAWIQYWVNDAVFQSAQGQAQIQLDTIDDVGGYLEGSFSATLQPTGTKPPNLTISGKFRVCRMPDQYPV